MAIQPVPFALQNASHPAAVFRQATSGPFVTGGVLASAELLMRQQGTPGMSIILGAGRGKVVGSSVSPPAGTAFTTQAMYDTLNDADLTLTIATSNPSNPRIDAAYIQAQDAFYTGAANTAIAGIVTGVPAVSPVAPAVPVNSLLIGYIAVGAAVASVVNANIAQSAPVVQLIGAVGLSATATTLAADVSWLAGTLRYVTANGSTWIGNGTRWVLNSVPRVASSAARDALYVSAVTPQQGDMVVRLDTGWTEQYFALYNAGSNVGGATVAGWYPVLGALPSARLRYQATQTFGGAWALANAVWGTPVQLQGMTYAAGAVTVVTPGWYEIDAYYRHSVAASPLGMQITLNSVALDTSATITRKVDTSTTAQENMARTTQRLATGDVIRFYIYAQASGTPGSGFSDDIKLDIRYSKQPQFT